MGCADGAGAGTYSLGGSYPKEIMRGHSHDAIVLIGARRGGTTQPEPPLRSSRSNRSCSKNPLSAEEAAARLRGARKDLAARHIDRLALMGEPRVGEDGVYQPSRSGTRTTGRCSTCSWRALRLHKQRGWHHSATPFLSFTDAALRGVPLYNRHVELAVCDRDLTCGPLLTTSPDTLNPPRTRSAVTSVIVMLPTGGCGNVSPVSPVATVGGVSHSLGASRPMLRWPPPSRTLPPRSLRSKDHLLGQEGHSPEN